MASVVTPIAPPLLGRHAANELAHAEVAGDNLRLKSGDDQYIWQGRDWPSWRCWATTPLNKRPVKLLKNSWCNRPLNFNSFSQEMSKD